MSILYSYRPQCLFNPVLCTSKNPFLIHLSPTAAFKMSFLPAEQSLYLIFCLTIKKKKKDTPQINDVISSFLSSQVIITSSVVVMSVSVGCFFTFYFCQLFFFLRVMLISLILDCFLWSREIPGMPNKAL